MIHKIVQWKLNPVSNNNYYFSIIISYWITIEFFLLFPFPFLIFNHYIITIHHSFIHSVSYTTKDLVFDWEESDPLVVEEHIELPQHDLINKDIDYCTTDYSSGLFILLFWSNCFNWKTFLKFFSRKTFFSFFIFLQELLPVFRLYSP